MSGRSVEGHFRNLATAPAADHPGRTYPPSQNGGRRIEALSPRRESLCRYTVGNTSGVNNGLYYPRLKSFDLRFEMHELLYGNYDQAPIGRPLLLRRIKDQKCVCWVSTEGGGDPNCKYCGGEGYLWTETLETGYITRNFGSVQNPATVISQENRLAQLGYEDENRALCFFEYTVFPNYERYLRPDHPSFDSLYELKVDPDGTLTRPVIRTAKWNVRSATPHQGDGGRVEFFELGLDKKSF